jgi:DNA ligase-associated metallophosphoesterase
MNPPSTESLTIVVAGHTLMLSAERAAFDPQSKSLFIADAHFGKDAVFRARGIPVPVGTTPESLARLEALVAAHRPEQIVFLGDLLHARESHADETLGALAAWRAKHRELRLVLVEGKHDKHAGALPALFGVDVVKEPHGLGPWALCHHPQTVDGAYALAGHEHPVYRLATRVDSARLPCFRFGRRAGVLPAFGAFTGGFEVNLDARGEAVYVIAGERIFPLSDRSSSTIAAS